jgi:predicted tellurium resistance membrane protein TerC
VEFLTDPDIWIAFLTLTVLEIVLGIDNVVFISILADKLPEHQRAQARRVGLGLAMIMRILLLLAISWVIGLTEPLFTIFSEELSGRDLILLGGGLFLLGKATYEIHDRLEGDEGHKSARVPASFGAVIAQIVALDLVFSLDSVITAVGTVDEVGVMIAAVVVAVAVMFVSASVISEFVSRHPTVKMLALSFLLLIGLTLVAESFDYHIPKGFIYFSIAFATFVEALNLRARRGRRAAEHEPPVHLRARYSEDDRGPAAEGAPGPPREPQPAHGRP